MRLRLGGGDRRVVPSRSVSLRPLHSPLPAFLLLLPSCNGSRVEIVLHGAPGFDPAEELGEITVRIEEAETGDRIGGRGSTRVGAADPALEGIDLQDGVAYRALVEGAAEERCREEKIAVGRSLPFVHDDGGDVVDLWVGCHGEASIVQDLPEPRALSAVSWVEEEARVLVTGGAPSATFDLAGFRDAPREASVFSMDVATGEWTTDEALETPRRLHAAAAAAPGLVVMGGGAESALGFDASVEVLSGSDRTIESALGASLLVPTAVRLASGRILVAGWEAPPGDARPLLIYDPDAGVTEFASVDVEALGGATLAVLDGGARVLVVGGALRGLAGETQPAGVRMFCEEPCGECAVAPCVVDVAIEGAAPADDWAFMAASYVPCDAGGGAVVVAGGGSGPMGEVVPSNALFCYRDEPGQIGTMAPLAETLATPRHGATAATVERAVDGGFWVFVVGGTGGTGGATPFPNDMEVVEINGCTCDPTGVAVRELPTSPEGATTTAGHAMATLGDGSVLVVGGFEPLELAEGAELDATSRVLRIR